MRRAIIAILAGSLLALAGCGGPVDKKTDKNGSNASGDNPTVLGPGAKADNFRSTSAKEYYVRGTTNITLADSYADKTEEERRQRVKDLIPYKQVVIGFFLNQYLIAKSSDDSNSDYGDFKALTKNGSYEDLGIEKQGDLTYSFEFVQEVGGQMNLLQKLADRAGAERNPDGSYTFEVAVGHVSNEDMMRLETGNAWYRESPWSSFSTDQVDESKYYMQELNIRPQERSKDAWIDYNELFADGTVNIEIFFGWDYHNDYHQIHSKSTYQWLVRNGYESPVSSWEEYATNRAPLTKTIRADGQEVDVKVTLWWGEPGTSTDPATRSGAQRLEEAMKESFRTNEITAFSGHSGPWYGFALANWKELGLGPGEIDDSEVPDLEMPSDKYQLVLAEGCDTYALGEAFWKNPNKSDEDTLDIITTTSFSNAGTHKAVTDMLDAVIGADSNSRLKTETYDELLQDLDQNSFWFQTMYGVHGIDDNPHGHPFADPANVCKSCSSNDDCGGTGNKCVNLEGSSVCTYECTADDGCPQGYSCRETRSGNTLQGSVCVPNNFTCSSEPEPDSGPSVRFTEILADPPSGEAGDANGDGTRDARDDEFFELTNTGDEAVDLSSWKFADNITVRYVFPGDTTLAPGEKLVVFGGGEPASYSGLPEGLKVFSAETGIYLNNGGDTISLIDHRGETVDSIEYGSEGGRDTSLVRDGETLTPADEITPGE